MDSLYYECHITTDPEFTKLSKILEIARIYHFKMADLLMVKNDGSEEQHVKDMFFTTRTNTYKQAEDRVKEFCRIMRVMKVGVRRYKIEDTLLDSKQGDPLNLIKEI